VERAQFERMVARLEAESAASPKGYRLRVALLAVLGFLILGAIVSLSGLGLLLLAGLAAFALVAGGKGIVLMLKLGKLLFLLAVPLWMLIKSSFSMLLRRLPKPEGLELQPEQAPRLFEVLASIRSRMKGPRFHQVLVTSDLNAGVVQRPLLGLMGFPRNYLILGLPLLEVLSPEEATAVVAHEYGHMAGSHTRFGAYIYRLRSAWGAIQELSHQWEGWTSRPLRRLVDWYAPYFNAYTFVLARANEYQADAASVELVGAGAAARALKRVNLSVRQYEQFIGHTFLQVRHAEAPPGDLALQWAKRAGEPLSPEQGQQWLGVALRRESGVDDTHPALRDRLRALPGQAYNADRLPEPIVGPTAAAAWFGEHADDLRKALQKRWSERLAGPWAERYAKLKSSRERLAHLDAKDEGASAGEQLERLRLRLELEPEREHLPDLVAFNQRHPDHPVGLFLEACQRLRREDETGLERLERVAELDEDAIKPACEAALAYLCERGDPRTNHWLERLHARFEFERRRWAELNDLSANHSFLPPTLGEGARRMVVELLASNNKGIERAYLARRVLPSDPKYVTYVLSLELTFWTRLRSKGPQIVERLSECEWPAHVFICALQSHQAVARKVKAVPGAEIASR
jgi:Zn-dependent protease with chaperone function